MALFEPGKFYKHSSDIYVSILEKVDTTQWGSALVAESPSEPNGLIPMSYEYNEDDWKEITKEEWLACFTANE